MPAHSSGLARKMQPRLAFGKKINMIPDGGRKSLLDSKHGQRWLASSILVSISYFWLILVSARAAGDLALQDILATFGLATLVLTVQLVVLLAVGRAQILLPAFALLNTYTLYIVFDGETILQDWKIQALEYAAIFFLYFAIFDVCRRWTWTALGVSVGAPAALLVFGGLTMLSGRGYLLNLGVDADANFQNIQFSEKPNVYFLSYDAMTPPTLTERFVGIESPPYMDVLEAHNAHVLKNTFADAVGTRFALSSVLELKANLDRDPGDLMTGKIQSALRLIFETNGYKTHYTMYYAYFGPEKGRYLASYNIYRPYSACDFIGGLTRTVGFFGICWMYDEGWFGNEPLPQISYPDYSFELLKSVSNDKSQPHFYMEHVLDPGHADSDYLNTPEEKEKFRARYLARSTAAASAMKRAIQQIKSSDPSGVIFIYGDHGMFISQRVPASENLKFKVQDNYGTVGALVNADKCIHYVNPPQGENYQTIARIAAGIVECLAGKRIPAISKIDYGRIRQLKETSRIETRFDQHLYE